MNLIKQFMLCKQHYEACQIVHMLYICKEALNTNLYNRNVFTKIHGNPPNSFFLSIVKQKHVH